jgi:septal ring factor EnvC (AmiA/AmiB activator)
MNHQLLKEIINNVVAKKISEAKGKGPVYGYIIADKGGNDPVLQLIGYGNMPKSSWKKKLIGDVNDLLKRIENDDWVNAAYIVEKNGVLYNNINMMKEIFEKELNEQLGTVQAADLDKSKKAEEAMSPADKRSMDAYQNALQKITDDVRKIDAEISKLQEPVRAKVSRLESKKATIQKKQGQLVTKIDSIKKKNM